MDLIDLSTVSSDDRFPRFIDQLCEKLELEFATYAAFNPITKTVQGYANYPSEWIEHYAENNMHGYDPVVHVPVRSIAPVDWLRLERNEKFQRVFNDGKEFGISDNGLTIPIRGPYGEVGLFSVSRDMKKSEWDSLKRKIMGDLQVAAVHLHDNVMRSGILPKMLDLPSLSTREKEVLQWTASGKNQQDIGDILSISHRTVEVHLRSAREKLSALTTAHAVGRAISLGLIYPE